MMPKLPPDVEATPVVARAAPTQAKTKMTRNASGRGRRGLR